MGVKITIAKSIKIVLKTDCLDDCIAINTQTKCLVAKLQSIGIYSSMRFFYWMRCLYANANYYNYILFSIAEPNAFTCDMITIKRLRWWSCIHNLWSTMIDSSRQQFFLAKTVIWTFWPMHCANESIERRHNRISLYHINSMDFAMAIFHALRHHIFAEKANQK